MRSWVVNVPVGSFLSAVAGLDPVLERERRTPLLAAPPTRPARDPERVTAPRHQESGTVRIARLSVNATRHSRHARLRSTPGPGRSYRATASAPQPCGR